MKNWFREESALQLYAAFLFFIYIHICIYKVYIVNAVKSSSGDRMLPVHFCLIIE